MEGKGDVNIRAWWILPGSGLQPEPKRFGSISMIEPAHGILSKEMKDHG